MFSKTLIQAVLNTWSQIGSDVLESYQDEEPDNEACVESCLDADRIVTYGGSSGAEAQSEFQAKIKQVGYSAALAGVVRSMPYPLV